MPGGRGHSKSAFASPAPTAHWRGGGISLNGELITTSGIAASASAAAILGATGVDTTVKRKSPSKAKVPEAPQGDTRTASQKLQPGVTAALEALLRDAPVSLEQGSWDFSLRAQEPNAIGALEGLHGRGFPAANGAGAEARRGEEGDEAAEAMEKRRERPTS